MNDCAKFWKWRETCPGRGALRSRVTWGSGTLPSSSEASPLQKCDGLCSGHWGSSTGQAWGRNSCYSEISLNDKTGLAVRIQRRKAQPLLRDLGMIFWTLMKIRISVHWNPELKYPRDGDWVSRGETGKV